ncbi:PspC domain-containing protein [Conexibacter woesei]|uniref:Phage shock protein C, PspC n=1 Tax=Conexibacter woesei (strain DSM 14684 / CCUG 47730 / CIP 108061 / JCM 11494 / NBRC 100937 / ID131577) TaxID=469383 RepID=D3F0N0_CONWI|nr:PspC domain-containing protein [Conexibacter woesei]ADB53964.1 phage shock protein C, PspC [Conexibacter woesei DSM 14684]
MTDVTSADPGHGDPLPQPLLRAQRGRWLAGVCRGLADRWGTPVGQVRALFAVAALFAGLGVLAYVACWLVLPAEGERDDGPTLLRGFASLALLAAACAGLVTIAVAAGAVTLFGFGWAVAVAVGVLLLGALAAWPTVRPAWILLPLAAATAPAVVVAASGTYLKPTTGQEIVTPRTPAELPSGGYEAGFGDLLVDLRGFQAPPRATVPLKIRAGVGDTIVALPRDRCFNLDVRYRIGGVALRALETLTARSLGGTNTLTAYGEWQGPSSGRWLRDSSDPDAPTLQIDFSSLADQLVIRDYPGGVDPLNNASWPDSIGLPLPPDARNSNWTEDNPDPRVQRRWRAWHRESERFGRTLDRLQRGACAPAEELR